MIASSHGPATNRTATVCHARHPLLFVGPLNTSSPSPSTRAFSQLFRRPGGCCTTTAWPPETCTFYPRHNKKRSKYVCRRCSLQTSAIAVLADPTNNNNPSNHQAAVLRCRSTSGVRRVRSLCPETTTDKSIPTAPPGNDLKPGPPIASPLTRIVEIFVGGVQFPPAKGPGAFAVTKPLRRPRPPPAFPKRRPRPWGRRHLRSSSYPRWTPPSRLLQ